MQVGFDLETEWNKTDIDGIRLKDELEKIGYLGDEEPGSRHLGAFFETHMEQGPILEDQGKTIGVVRLGQGIRWYNVTITGRESHSGTTPMYLRKDAVVCKLNDYYEVKPLCNAMKTVLAPLDLCRFFLTPGMSFRGNNIQC
ncbi:hypothetical protein P4S72_30040 [Vibrio sp. PP-XX7]